MYTLEDDQETSSRLKKREFEAATGQGGGEQDEQNGQGDDLSSGVEVITAEQPLPGSESGMGLTKRFSKENITSSFKKLTTPSKANTSAGNGRIALAALTVACISVFFTAMDQTVVVTALPQIITDLKIPITQLDHASWIVSAYLLGFVVVMPLMGRVSDIYGRRRIFLLCLSIFGIGSILCGIAPILGDTIDISFLSALHIDTSSPGLIWLIAARLLQAMGGGAVVPVAMAIAGDFYGQEKRGLALGIIGAVTEAGGVVGPLYGALIVRQPGLGWQYIFYLNVPLVIVLIIAAAIFIPKGKRLHEGIDWLGALLLGLALICLSLGLAQQSTDLGTVSTSTSAAPQNNPLVLALAVILLVAFVLVERKRRWPVVDVRLFKKLTFTASSLVSLLVGAALIIAMADIPIFVDTVLGLQVLDSGLALMRLTVMIPLGALLGGWLCSRISCRFTGVLGLLFTAAGFFLMSRWPIHVDWTQITISTVTAGFGFGLVIAPIGTTAINSVRATQAGMGSAVVTALRMVGMTLGLAALTSWALAYFKQLVSTYPSLPLNSTAAQFSAWSKGYATHVIASAHTVYNAVFFVSMILCLLAIVPAIFLWGNKPPVEEVSEPVLAPDFHEAMTLNVVDMPTGPIPLPLGGASELAETPDVPVLPDEMNSEKGKRNPKRKRLLIIGGIALVLLLILGGGLAAYMLGPDDSTAISGTSDTGTSAGTNPTTVPTGAVISGPRMFDLALGKDMLTSLFAQQLNLKGGALSDLTVTPKAGDGLSIGLNLNINSSGIHRVLPIELDGTIGIDSHQNLQLQVSHLKRDGQDAGPAAAAQMQTAINQLIVGSVMPSLHGQLKGVKLISVHTSSSVVCGKGVEMLVLQIQAPPIQGIAAQPTPVPFCISNPSDLNKMMH